MTPFALSTYFPLFLRGPLNFNHLFHEEAPFRFRTCWRRPGLPGFVS